MAWTNNGKEQMLLVWVRGVAAETNLYVALLTSATAVGVDTNVMSDVTEVAAGNGYTAGGIQLTPNATDFDVLTVDEPGDYAYAQIKDLVWTASGGNLPSSGAARYAALTDDEGVVANREVYLGWDLGSDRVVSDTQTLTLQNCEFRIT